MNDFLEISLKVQGPNEALLLIDTNGGEQVRATGTPMEMIESAKNILEDRLEKRAVFQVEIWGQRPKERDEDYKDSLSLIERWVSHGSYRDVHGLAESRTDDIVRDSRKIWTYFHKISKVLVKDPESPE